MGKNLEDTRLAEISQEELEVLSGVVGYAERMIKEGSLEYRDLRREAYGKSVLITKDNGEKEIFRLSSTSLIYPNRSSGYATPHSPVGRLCSVASIGYEGFSKAWGCYEVKEIRHFRRYEREELNKQVKNFRSMKVGLRDGNQEVMNLKYFVDRVFGKKKAGTAVSKLNKSEDKEKKVPNDPVDEGVPSQIQAVPGLTILDDVDDELLLDLVEDIENEDVIEEVSSYIGLDDNFFLNRTWAQDKVISRSPVGPMWVEGVAGSGKTSAALGRTKMLCDFNSKVVSEKKVFQDLLGDDFDYWEEEFAGKFSQEGSVGFVRTAELIQYLQETCSRLGMPDLPIQEYQELRSKLISWHKLESAGVKKVKYCGDPSNPAATSLEWLYAAERAVAELLADEIEKSAMSLACNNDVGLSGEQDLLFKEAVNALALRIKVVCDHLDRSQENLPLYGLARKITKEIYNISEEILGAEAWCVKVDDLFFYGSSIPRIAHKLTESDSIFCASASTALVVYNDEGLVGGSKSFLLFDAENNKISLEEALVRTKEKLLVRAALQSENVLLNAYFVQQQEFFIHLGNKDSVYVLQNKAARRLRLYKGLGILKAGEGQAPSKIFVKASISGLVRPLKEYVRIYASAIEKYHHCFPDALVADKTLARLKSSKINDDDIDLILCLANHISDGVEDRKVPAGLRASPFFDSVFIDEVQDFTEQQIHLMTSQADPSYYAITVVGDRSQQLSNNKVPQVDKCFPYNKKPIYVELKENLRQSGAVELSQLSDTMRTGLKRFFSDEFEKISSWLSVEQEGKEGAYLLKVFRKQEEEFSYIASVINSISEDQTIAVVLPDQESAETLKNYCQVKLEGNFRKLSVSEQIELSKKYLIHFTSVANVKGLEFDVTLLPMLEKYDLSQAVCRNRLYVGVSRAKRKLIITRSACIS